MRLACRIHPLQPGLAMLDWILKNDFMPHGHCYFWRADILWTHVVSDAVIALSYFSIPVTLLYFLRRRPDVPFPMMIVLFAAFIVLCGSGHLLEIWTVWNPIYALQGIEKLATAVVSLVTAVAMIPIVPQALAMRSPAQIQVEVDRAVGDLKAAQAQLVQQEKMASLGAVVAGVAHEINTPVGVSVTAASTLQALSSKIGDKYAASALSRNDLETYLASAQECADIILRNMQRAANLIQSFKQVAVDQTVGDRRPFEIRSYIDEVLLSLAPQLRKSPHAVVVSCPDTLVLDSYPGALAQILTNLVNNSLMHAFPEGRSGSIGISVSEDADTVVLLYTDDGLGIPADHLPHVFEPFFTTKRGQGGSGLGLHIVYKLTTETLGGTVEIRSPPDNGVEVRIAFPRHPRALPSAPRM
jgi:signal transduction histidine kinase